MSLEEKLQPEEYISVVWFYTALEMGPYVVSPCTAGRFSCLTLLCGTHLLFLFLNVTIKDFSNCP